MVTILHETQEFRNIPTLPRNGIGPLQHTHHGGVGLGEIETFVLLRWACVIVVGGHGVERDERSDVRSADGVWWRGGPLPCVAVAPGHPHRGGRG
jgi:hypothetical protein